MKEVKVARPFDTIKLHVSIAEKGRGAAFSEVFLDSRLLELTGCPVRELLEGGYAPAVEAVVAEFLRQSGRVK